MSASGAFGPMAARIWTGQWRQACRLVFAQTFLAARSHCPWQFQTDARL